MNPLKRRFALLLSLSAAMFAAPFSWSAEQASDKAGGTLTPWRPGMLDIHHLATGRGSATLIIMPDGTSLLIDAGASAGAPEVSTVARPDSQRRPGEYIARYAERQLRATGRSGLDYLLVTHFHPDHLGDVTDSSPMSAKGNYRLTGVSDVAELMEVRTLVDRSYPRYEEPVPIAQMGRFGPNYLAFVADRRSKGLKVEAFEVGSDSQFSKRDSAPGNRSFGIRNIAANGNVWRADSGKRPQFPALSSLDSKDRPNENMYSTAIRIHSGRFAYFTAGDLTSYTFDGDLPWQDVLGPAARSAGPVDVATADHHGLFDGLNADVVRQLRPQAWVIPSWHISHPDLLQMERMFSERLYPGPRDVFATNIMRENFLANRRLLQKLRSLDGHIVVRVEPGGEVFSIVVTDNKDEQDLVKLVTGPYVSGKK